MERGLVDVPHLGPVAKSEEDEVADAKECDPETSEPICQNIPWYLDFSIGYPAGDSVLGQEPVHPTPVYFNMLGLHLASYAITTIVLLYRLGLHQEYLLRKAAHDLGVDTVPDDAVPHYHHFCHNGTYPSSATARGSSPGAIPLEFGDLAEVLATRPCLFCCGT